MKRGNYRIHKGKVHRLGEKERYGFGRFDCGLEANPFDFRVNARVTCQRCLAAIAKRKRQRRKTNG